MAAYAGGKGGRCVRLKILPPSCAVVTKSGNLNFLEPYGPLQACNGTALPLPLHLPLPFTNIANIFSKFQQTIPFPHCAITPKRAGCSLFWFYRRNSYKRFLYKWWRTKTVTGRATVLRTWNARGSSINQSINHMELNRFSNHLSELSLKCQW